MGSTELVLPPLVCGKLNGYLTITVDEVLWTKAPGFECYVEVCWWGSRETVLFRPSNISGKITNKSSDVNATFNIRTSQALFTQYLKNCGKLTFDVFKLNHDKLGSVTLNDLDKVIVQRKDPPSYYPILNSVGSKIGDLHIGFTVWFKSKSDLEKTDSSKPKRFVQRRNPEAAAQTEVDEYVGPDTQSIIEGILKKGQKLRDAMVASVLSDCPVDSIEKMVVSKDDGDTQEAVPASKTSKQLMVDYLSGKEMDPKEEALALQRLQCISPTESLINLLTLSPSKSGSRGDVQPVPSTQSISLLKPLDDTKPPKRCQDVVNCYRLLINSLELTPTGIKKINTGLKKGTKAKGGKQDLPAPPGVTYIGEYCKPTDAPGGQAKQLRFSTKVQKNAEVSFKRSVIYPLKESPDPWSKIGSSLKGSTFKLFWRHLHQRVPSLLGSCGLPTDELPNIPPTTTGVRTNIVLPVHTNNGLLAGQLRLAIELGKNKKLFGNDLLVEFGFPVPAVVDNASQAGDLDIALSTPRPPESYKPSSSRVESQRSAIGTGRKSEGGGGDGVRVSVEPIPVPPESETIMPSVNRSRSAPEPCGWEQCRCSCCGISVIRDTPRLSARSTEPMSGRSQPSHPNPPTNFPCTHEISVTVEKVSGFPMFYNPQVDMDCFVEYSLPVAGAHDTLVKPMKQSSTEVSVVLRDVLFSTMVKHEIKLHQKSLKEALENWDTKFIEFALWGRFYGPVPKDVVLAKALLPTAKLSIMESEARSLKMRSRVSETVILPLLVVPSAMTAALSKVTGVGGSMTVTITYKLSTQGVERPISQRTSQKSQQVQREVEDTTRYLAKECQVSSQIRNTMDPPEPLPPASPYIDPRTVRSCLKNAPTGRPSHWASFGCWGDTNHLAHNTADSREEGLSRRIDIVARREVATSTDPELPPTQDKAVSPVFFPPSTPGFMSPCSDLQALKLNHNEDHEHWSRIPADGDDSRKSIGIQPSPDDTTTSGSYSMKEPPHHPGIHRSVSDTIIQEVDCLGRRLRHLDPLSKRFPGVLLAPAPRLSNYEKFLMEPTQGSSSDSMKSLPEAMSQEARVFPLSLQDIPPRLATQLPLSRSVDSLSPPTPQDNQNHSQCSSGLFVEYNRTLPDQPTAQIPAGHYFKARIEIERAFNLPLQTDNGVATKPSTYVAFKAFDLLKRETTYKTKTVFRERNPVWDGCWDVLLPAQLLYKVNITPLEDISKYKSLWLKEYSSASQPGWRSHFTSPVVDDLTVVSCGSGSVGALDLRSKLSELDAVTQDIRRRMQLRPNFTQLPSFESESGPRHSGPTAPSSASVEIERVESINLPRSPELDEMAVQYLTSPVNNYSSPPKDTQLKRQETYDRPPSDETLSNIVSLPSTEEDLNLTTERRLFEKYLDIPDLQQEQHPQPSTSNADDANLRDSYAEASQEIDRIIKTFRERHI